MKNKNNESTSIDLNTDEPIKKKGNPINKKKLLGVIGIIVVIGALIVGYFVYQGQNYVSTVDARIESNMVTINSPSLGRLTEWTGLEGKTVKQDEIVGRIEGISITSPIDGKIVKVSVKEGQTLSPGQVTGYVADLENLYVTANIEETKIGLVKAGQEVTIKVDAFGSEKFKGIVTSVGDATNSVFSMISTNSSNNSYTKITQLVPVRIAFKEAISQGFKIGMNAEIKINVKKAVSQPDKTDPGKNGAYEISGTLSPAADFSISAKVSGQVQAIKVGKGDRVVKGQLLVIQDDTDVQLQSGSGGMARDTVAKLKMSYQSALDNYQQNQVLYGEGAISKTAFDQITLQKETARIAYQSAATALSNQENKTSIIAPSDGIVTSISVSEGEYLTVGKPVIGLSDLSKVVLKGNVSEDKINSVKEGQAVKVVISSINKTVEGKITFISSVGLNGSKSFPIEITIDNSKGEIKAGMTATTEI